MVFLLILTGTIFLYLPIQKDEAQYTVRTTRFAVRHVSRYDTYKFMYSPIQTVRTRISMIRHHTLFFDMKPAA